MRHNLRGISAIAGVAVLLCVMSVGVAAPAHAAGGPVVSGAGAAAPSAVPNSNIVAKTGRRVNYHPKVLSSKITTGRCTKETEDITITNTTERSQTITLDGSTFYNLPGEQQVGVCFPHRGVYLFGLAANVLAKLIVTAA